MFAVEIWRPYSARLPLAFDGDCDLLCVHQPSVISRLTARSYVAALAVTHPAFLTRAVAVYRHGSAPISAMNDAMVCVPFARNLRLIFSHAPAYESDHCCTIRVFSQHLVLTRPTAPPCSGILAMRPWSFRINVVNVFSITSIPISPDRVTPLAGVR